MIQYRVPDFLTVNRTGDLLEQITDEQLQLWTTEAASAQSYNDEIYQSARAKCKQLVEIAREIYGEEGRVYRYLRDVALLEIDTPPLIMTEMFKLAQSVNKAREAATKRKRKKAITAKEGSK